MRVGSTQAVELGTFFFFYFFDFFQPLSFLAKSNTVRNTAGDQKQHERERVRKEREREKETEETERSDSKKSLSLYTQSGMDLQGSKLKQEKYMHSFGGCTYVCLLQKLERVSE